MMKHRKKQQNNAQIAQLFDIFAESLPSQPHLIEKAAREATPSARPKRNRSWIFALATCCVVILIAVCVFPNLFPNVPQQPTPGDISPTSPGLEPPAHGDKGDVGDPGPIGGPSLMAHVFDKEDVGDMVVLASAKAESYLPISVLKEQPQFSVTYERYYAYYFKSNGELAYIQAILGVETEEGIVEINLIADNHKYVEASRLEAYYHNIYYSDQQVVINNSAVENGEYVTRAYFNANNFNFYFYAQSNQQNSAEIQEIVKIFSQKWDKTVN